VPQRTPDAELVEADDAAAGRVHRLELRRRLVGREGMAAALGGGAKLPEVEATIAIQVEPLELLPERGEVAHAAQQRAELRPTHPPVRVRVRRLVRPHQRRLVVVVREELHRRLVDLRQRERARLGTAPPRERRVEPALVEQ
jgi:hypothetical protein